MDEERAMVLRMLKEGKISVQEADALLQALAEQPTREETVPADGLSDEASTKAGAKEEDARPGAGMGAVLRDELREVFRELMETIPDVRREIDRARETFRPPFAEILRGLRGLSEGQAETRAEVPMRAGETLDLAQAWGDVRLRAEGEGPMRLRAVRRVWSSSAEEARREAQHLPVEIRRDGGTVHVHVPRLEGRRTRVDFEITVPRGVMARVDVAKGDVRVEGLAAADLRIARGEAHAAGIAGDVRLEMRSGDVEAREIRGRLEGRIVSGDVAVSDVSGPVAVTTTSGDVTLTGVRATEVSVRTLSGDAALDLAELRAGAVIVETVSGDIRLAVPDDARATVEAATRAGDITTAVPLAEQTAGVGSLRGILNAPGARVRLQATRGDIRIVRR
ncbi:MAG TPA: DUF4097 family beta strand repeat-containing protein [bacterium]|nr:DUF4097 family beta strand repeat-containing protein [bacterium]